MNRHMKILKVMDVDAQNLPLDDFQDAEGMVNFYMRKTDEEIDAIYKEYYGEDDKDDFPNMKLLIAGEFEFQRDDVEALRERTIIHRIDVIRFVPAERAMEYGEKLLLSEGYDSYIILNDFKGNICTVDNHYWYAEADDGGVVVFDDHMNLVVGCWNVAEMHKHFADNNPAMIIDTKHDRKQVFCWRFHDQDNPWWKEAEKARQEAEKARQEAKKKAEEEREALIVRLTEEIVENNELYQNLYQCTEAKKELLEDDQLWKEVMERVISFIEAQVEAITEKSTKNLARSFKAA